MSNDFWSSGILPTEAATYRTLILTVIGTAGTVALGELIKEKKEVPVRSLVIWAGIFAIATAASVYYIAERSK